MLFVFRAIMLASALLFVSVNAAGVGPLAVASDGAGWASLRLNDGAGPLVFTILAEGAGPRLSGVDLFDPTGVPALSLRAAVFSNGATTFEVEEPIIRQELRAGEASAIVSGGSASIRSSIGCRFALVQFDTEAPWTRIELHECPAVPDLHGVAFFAGERIDDYDLEIEGFGQAEVILQEEGAFYAVLSEFAGDGIQIAAAGEALLVDQDRELWLTSDRSFFGAFGIAFDRPEGITIRAHQDGIERDCPCGHLSAAPEEEVRLTLLGTGATDDGFGSIAGAFVEMPEP